MRIKHQQPYWVKYSWEMNSNHQNQYVTEFNKTEDTTFQNICHEKKYIITCYFSIPYKSKNDKFSALFGKPGMNLCLSYCPETSAIAFEFWTTGDDEPKFNYLRLLDTKADELIEGLSVSIIRNNNKFFLYKNFEINNSLEFEGELIDDYKMTGLFIGCANPGSSVPEHRYYSEFDIQRFYIIKGQISIGKAKNIFTLDSTTQLLTLSYYESILCYYDFKQSNNLGIIYDESKYNNFLERVPTAFLNL